MRPRDYWRETRDLTTSFFFVSPLLAFYEVGILVSAADVRNGADLLLRNLFGVFGEKGLLAFTMLLFLLSVLAGIEVLRRNRPVLAFFPVALLESLVYAVVFAPLVLFVQYHVVPALAVPSEPDGGIFLSLVLSAGAGVYEELVFRLLLAGALFRLFEGPARLRRGVAGVLAVLLASLLFSAFHHVGTFGEPFEIHAFFFRLLAGILLSAIFLVRGLAVAVYTHALYDMLLFLQTS